MPRHKKNRKNTKYKNSVFTLLFNDTELLRELYCALEGVTLPQNTPVIVNTLQNVLFISLCEAWPKGRVLGVAIRDERHEPTERHLFRDRREAGGLNRAPKHH